MKKSKTKPEGGGKAPLFSFRYLIHDFVRVTAALPGLLWFRPRILYAGKKQKQRGGVLIISNHIGLYDPVYLMFAVWYRRHRFICMREFYEKPFVAFLFRSFLTIPIDRKNLSMDSFRVITDSLQAGSAVTMFPGGHVDTDGSSLDSFKSGMVLMALRSGVPILPVLITRRRHWYNRMTAVIGEPVDIRASCGEHPTFAQVNEMTKLLVEREKNLISYLPGNGNYSAEGATHGGKQ